MSLTSRPDAIFTSRKAPTNNLNTKYDEYEKYSKLTLLVIRVGGTV